MEVIRSVSCSRFSPLLTSLVSTFVVSMGEKADGKLVGDSIDVLLPSSSLVGVTVEDVADAVDVKEVSNCTSTKVQGTSASSTKSKSTIAAMTMGDGGGMVLSMLLRAEGDCIADLPLFWLPGENKPRNAVTPVGGGASLGGAIVTDAVGGDVGGDVSLSPLSPLLLPEPLEPLEPPEEVGAVDTLVSAPLSEERVNVKASTTSCSSFSLFSSTS